MKHSIRTKLMRTFILLLCAFLIFSSAFTLFSMRFLRNTVLTSAEQLGNLASRSSHEAIVSQALDAADSFVTEKAQTISQALDAYVNAAAEMADYVTYLYEHPNAFKPQSVATPAELVQAGEADGPVLQYIPATNDVAGPDAAAERALLGNLAIAFSIVYQNMPGISSIYTAHESGANIGYDRNAALKADTPTLDCRSFAWYTAVKASETLYVSQPYEDRFGRGLTVTLAQPILVNGAFNGVLGVDILIEDIHREIQTTRYGDGGYAMLFGSGGSVISARDRGDSSVLLGTAAQDALLAMQTEESGFVESRIDQEDVYILFAPVPSVSWTLTVVVPVADMLKSAEADDQAIQAISTQTLNEMDRISNRISLMMLGLFIALVVVSVMIVRSVCNRLSRPILALSKGVENISEGNLDYHSNIHTGDEIELLGTRFESMTVSLRSYIDHLTQATAERERLSAELNIAAKIQMGALPRVFPDCPEFSIFATMVPAREVGGDFYDLFQVDSDHFMVVIADVSGKGIPAALFMMTSKTLIRTLANTGLSPADVLNEANARLCENNKADMFVTAWIGLLQLSTGRFVYANAGHNPPLIRRKNEDFEYLNLRPGFVLAGLDSVCYREAETVLEPGDLLYLYTDGVTEATNLAGQLYGEARLKTTLDRIGPDDLKALLSGVKTDIDAFAAGAAQFDDITMLALRIDQRGDGA